MVKKQSSKPIDIAKEGPLNWRQLQQQNNNPYETSESLGLPTMGSFNPLPTWAHTYEGEERSPLMQQTTQTGGRDYFGNSVWDPQEVSTDQFQNLSDIRAENQPWYSKLVNGVGKAGVLAATTALETAGLLYGVGQGIYNTANAEDGKGGEAFLHGLWDNPITNALQSINEASEELMPNYYTRDEQENPFGNIFTANFLGDKILKNLGFMVGAFYGGIPASAALGKIGTSAVKSARAASLAERAGMARRVADLTAQYGDDVIGLERALAANGLTEAERGKRILAGFDRVKDAARTTRATTQTIGALGSAINEGAIEALNNSKDWARQQTQLADDEYQQILAGIEQNYGGTEMETTLKMQAAEDHERKLAEIEKGRARMGNADLLLNIPVLMASNVYQLGKLYTRGFDSTRRQLGSMWNGHVLEGSLAKGTLKSGKTAKGAVTSALLKSNTEGLEEYLQRAASDGAGNAVTESINRFMTSGQGEESKNEIDDYIAGFGKAIADNLSDPNAWEEYMIGAVSSMLGMPVFGSQTKNAYIGKDKAFGFAGGIVGNYQDYMQAKEHEEQIAKYLNERVQDPKFKALYDNLRKNNDLDKLIDGTLSDNDKAKYKELEYEKLFNDINAAASSGHLAEFREMIGYNKDYSDEELEDIVKSTAKKVTAEQQKQQDIQKKAYLEKEIANLEKEDRLSANMHNDLWNYREQLKEVNQRLEADQYQDKDEGPFLMRAVNGQTIGMNITEEGKQQMKDILERNKQNLLESIDDYLKIRNDIDIETDGRLDDNQIALLTQMRGKILSYDKRSAEMADDLIGNLQGVRELQESWRNKVNEDRDKAQVLFDRVSKQLENAKKNGAKKKEIERLEKNKAAAEKKLNKAKSAINGLNNAVKLLEMLAEEKETTAKERAAEAGGYGEGVVGRMQARMNRGQQRQINSDEAQAILANPLNAMSLISIINSRTSDLDNKTREKLTQEVVDLATLANEKMAYNKKVREFLGDPSKINEAFQQAQDKVSQQERDNKSEELSLRLREASSMSELDGIMREAYQQNPEIARAAMQKAKQTADDSQKQFLNDYEKGVNFFGTFSQQASQLAPEIGAGIMETAVSAWEYALADGVSPYDTFVQALNDAADDLDATNMEGAKQQADAIRKILKDLDAATKKTATNKNTKKGTTTKKAAKTGDSEETPDDNDKKDLGALAALRKKATADTRDSLTKAIEDEVRNSKQNGRYAVNEAGKLSKELRDRIAKFVSDPETGEIIAENDIDVDAVIAAVLEKLIDEDIANSGDYEIKEGDGTEVGDYEEGSQRAENMHNNLRVSFKSDHPTEFRFNLDYRVPYVSEDPQLMAIQKLMQEYKAYQFVDKNYLGYVAMANDGHPTIHFLKSTDPAVDGSSGTDSTIFMAIKWDKKAEDAVRKYGFNGRKDVNLQDELKPVTINGEQYQIVGVMTLNAEIQPEVSAAFAAAQNAINGELNPQMEAAREAGQPFVLSEKTTQIDQIFTGRLEKRNDEKDGEAKVSLYDFMTDKQGDDSRRTSTEWDSGMDFYFGTVVNGFLNTTDKQEVTDWMEQPNDIWMEKNNGAVVLFLPKPDGRLYPVRCTRLTVEDWLNGIIDGQHTGLHLLENILSGETKNQYLNNIVGYLETILSDDAALSDRMNAKMMLSKYFIFGKNSPIHFNDGSVSLTFENRQHDVEGDNFNDRVFSFFSILAQEGIMFTLPTESIESINGRDVIKAGIFEIGLRNFYNFNANFTVYPIDGNGQQVVVEIPEDDNDEFKGGNGMRSTNVEFDLGDGMKTYTILSDGTVLENGERVSTDKQNLVSLAMQAEQSNMPQLLQEMLSTLYPKSAEVRKYISDNVPSLQGVYIIHADGQDWVYDRRKGNHNERLYKLTPEVTKEFTQIIRNFTTKPESMEQIKKLKKEVKPTENTVSEISRMLTDVLNSLGISQNEINTIIEEISKIPINADTNQVDSFIEKAFNLNKKAAEWLYKEEGRGFRNKLQRVIRKQPVVSATSVKDEARENLRNVGKQMKDAMTSSGDLEVMDSLLELGRGALEEARTAGVEPSFINNINAIYKGLQTKANNYRKTRDKTVSSGSSVSPKMFAGKTLEDLDGKGSSLEALMSANSKSPVVKRVFEALQSAEEGGLPIDQERIRVSLETVLAAKKEEKRRQLADLINKIKGCDS